MKNSSPVSMHLQWEVEGRERGQEYLTGFGKNLLSRPEVLKIGKNCVVEKFGEGMNVLWCCSQLNYIRNSLLLINSN